MSTPSVRALGYLELGVSSLAAWRTYAEQVLGVACSDRDGGMDLRYDADAWRIRLVETGEDDVRCAGFEVATADDLAALRARLEGRGIAVAEAGADAAAARRVDRLLRCQDPFGLPVELYVGNRTLAEPFTSPAGVAGFVTGGQGLGHMVLAVGDRERAEAFYMQGLGFRLSDHIHMGPPGRQITLTFLHCNPRHHTVALAPVPSPRRLNHIMLQVASVDDVGLALDRVRAAGAEISSSLGRHTNDRMLSFYVRTPSGFDVEYGCDGVEIDDASWVPETYHAPSIWGHKGSLN